MATKRSKFLHGKRIDPAPIHAKTSVAELVDEAFLAYNGARLREACQLFTKKMLEPEVTVGVSITGALTPAGFGYFLLDPTNQGWFHRLDYFHRRQSLSRHSSSESVFRCIRVTRKRLTSSCAKKR